MTKGQHKCQVGHPELLIPAESAINELSLDMRFNTVPGRAGPSQEEGGGGFQN